MELGPGPLTDEAESLPFVPWPLGQEQQVTTWVKVTNMTVLLMKKLLNQKALPRGIDRFHIASFKVPMPFLDEM